MPVIDLNPPFTDWPALEQLLREAYGPMADRIDPPSFLQDMTQQDIIDRAQTEDLFLAFDTKVPVACGFGVQHGDVYELGKVAVAASHRKRGLARRMTDRASDRAKALGASTVQLYVRVELVENHAVYAALGFAHHADFTHSGYDKPTAYILRRQI